MPQTSHLRKEWSQAQLLALGCDVVDEFEKLIDHFDLNDMKFQGGDVWVGPCPVHGGDKWDAFNIYTDGHTTKGNWLCNTRMCQEEFCNSPIGFIRGILSHRNHGWEFKGDETASFMEAVEWCASFVNKDYDDLVVDEEDKDKRAFAKSVGRPYRASKVSGPSREQIQASGLVIPAPHYELEYDKETLVRYDVGLCNDKGKPFYRRTVVPVYDITHRFMVGCTGRSMYPQCEKCQGYHYAQANQCPKIRYPKWKHSYGFKSEDHLYNLWYAKSIIKKTGVVVVVESPGNVWRLEEAGIHNSVAVFGTALKTGQKVLLDKSGALCILVIGDNDEGGDTLIQSVRDKCDDLYNVIGIKPEGPHGHDIGKMRPGAVEKLVSPYLSKLSIYGDYLND